MCWGLLIKQERVDKGIETDGSNLSGVSAKCSWDDLSRPPDDDEDSRSICVGSQPRHLTDKGQRLTGSEPCPKTFPAALLCISFHSIRNDYQTTVVGMNVSLFVN